MLEKSFARFHKANKCFLAVNIEDDDCATHLWDAIFTKFDIEGPLLTSISLSTCLATAMRFDGDVTEARISSWYLKLDRARKDLKDRPSMSVDEIFNVVMLSLIGSHKHPAFVAAYTEISNRLEDPTTSSTPLDFDKMQDIVINRVKFHTAAHGATQQVFAVRSKPMTGLDHQHDSCKGCPHHCRHTDGKWRNVTVPRPRNWTGDRTSSSHAYSAEFDQPRFLDHLQREAQRTQDTYDAYLTNVLKSGAPDEDTSEDSLGDEYVEAGTEPERLPGSRPYGRSNPGSYSSSRTSST
jgi:hypothetical protein